MDKPKKRSPRNLNASGCCCKNAKGNSCGNIVGKNHPNGHYCWRHGSWHEKGKECKDSHSSYERCSRSKSHSRSKSQSKSKSKNRSKRSKSRSKSKSSRSRSKSKSKSRSKSSSEAKTPKDIVYKFLRKSGERMVAKDISKGVKPLGVQGPKVRRILQELVISEKINVTPRGEEPKMWWA